jgi:hypothetical protein
MEADEVDRFSFMFVRYGVELSGLKMPLYSGSPTWSWLVLMSDVLMCNFLYSVRFSYFRSFRDSPSRVLMELSFIHVFLKP